MKDYTEIFSEAIKNSAGYDSYEICSLINSNSDYFCGEVELMAYNSWYVITSEIYKSKSDFYGYICIKYPVALLTDYCPEQIKIILAENNVLFTELSEPMSCNENILKQFVGRTIVFDENFVETEEYSYDDERFRLLLYRLETGSKNYIDSSCFLMREIQYAI